MTEGCAKEKKNDLGLLCVVVVGNPKGLDREKSISFIKSLDHMAWCEDIHTRFFFNGKHEEDILQITKSVILDMVVFISFFQSDNLFGFSSQKIMVTTRYHSFLDM